MPQATGSDQALRTRPFEAEASSRTLSACRVPGNPAIIRHNDRLFNLPFRYLPVRPQKTFPVVFSNELIPMTPVERKSARTFARHVPRRIRGARYELLRIREAWPEP